MRRSATLATAILVLTGAVLSGCATGSGGAPSAAPQPAERVVYPPPPSAPVVEWVRTFDSIVARDTKEKRLRRILVGEDEQANRLSAPTSVAFQSEGTLAVVDATVRDAIVLFEVESGFGRLWSGDAGARFARPVAVASANDGRLLVADAKAAAVFLFDPGLTLQRIIGQGVIVRPAGIAVTGDGSRLAVTDPERHQVHLFDTGTGELLYSLGAEGGGPDPGDFKFPTWAAFDRQGYLYVSDYINFRVQVFDPSGDLDDTIGEAGDRPGKLARPRGIAVDSEAGIIYLADGLLNIVQMFNLDGELLMYFGYPGSAPGRLNLPSGVAVHGTLIAVADSMNHRVHIYRFLGVPTDR